MIFEHYKKDMKMSSKTPFWAFALIIFLVMPSLLGCGAYLKLYGDLRYPAYPEDHPVILECPYEKEERDLYGWNREYLGRSFLYVATYDIPGYERWKEYFEKSVPSWIQERQYIEIGKTRVSAKRKLLVEALAPRSNYTFNSKQQWYDSGQRMIKKGVGQFKTRAREHGADAVIDIRFWGSYYREMYTDGVVDLSPMSEYLYGTLIRRSDK